MIQTFINMFTSFVNTLQHLHLRIFLSKLKINLENENKIKHFPWKLIEFTNDFIGCYKYYIEHEYKGVYVRSSITAMKLYYYTAYEFSHIIKLSPAISGLILHNIMSIT